MRGYMICVALDGRWCACGYRLGWFTTRGMGAVRSCCCWMYGVAMTRRHLLLERTELGRSVEPLRNSCYGYSKDSDPPPPHRHSVSRREISYHAHSPGSRREAGSCALPSWRESHGPYLGILRRWGATSGGSRAIARCWRGRRGIGER